MRHRSRGRTWSSSATPGEAAPVRCSDNECRTIPKLAGDGAIFPFENVVAPCDPEADKQFRFFFEKS